MVWSHLPAQEKFIAEWVVLGVLGVLGVRPNVVYSPGPGLGPLSLDLSLTKITHYFTDFLFFLRWVRIFEPFRIF